MKVIKPTIPGVPSFRSHIYGEGTPVVLEFATTRGSVQLSFVINPPLDKPYDWVRDQAAIKDMARPMVEQILLQLV